MAGKSSKLVDALDLEKENPMIHKKNGHGLPVLKSGMHPCEWHTEQFLVARWLIQAGLRCVTLNFSTWDSHRNNFPRMRRNMPYVDLGVAALVDDSRNQGMLDDLGHQAPDSGRFRSRPIPDSSRSLPRDQAE